MQRPCDECKTMYPAKRATSRYCSDRCRVRRSRRRKDGIEETPTLAVITSDAPATPLADATRAELVERGIEATADGILLLTLATRIDAVPETSPALAALSREYAARKTDLYAASRPARVNPFDELQAARERRRAY